MSQFTVIGNGRIHLRFVQKENGLLFNSVSTSGEDPVRYDGFLPFVYCPVGESNGTNGADVGVYKQGLGDFKMQSFQRVGDTLAVCYVSEQYGVRVECEFEFIQEGGAVRSTVSLYAERDVEFTDFYGIFPLTHFEPTENERYTLSYRRNKWQGEGQWRTESLKELDFVDYYRHSPLNSFCLQNYGSQTTSEYYPALLLSDREEGEEWLLEGTPQGSWSISLSQWRGLCQTRGVLLFSFAGIEERRLHSLFRLKKGESYRAAECVLSVGSAERSVFQAAYQEKRRGLTYSLSTPKLLCNDYMNCLWAKPTLEGEYALIEASRRLGVEYYIVDDGWYCYQREIGKRLGDWNTDTDIFGREGLQGLLTFIKDKGMIPGIWFEIEVVGDNSEVAKKHPEWLLQVCGKRYGTPARRFLDFRKKEVGEFFLEKVRALYDMGVRYFKMDYNDSYFQADGSENNASLQENYLAVKRFYRSLQERFQDAIFENCASGGKRSDRGILSLFHLQSVSDQEEYWRYPSILIGSLINNLPEKTGVWCMPYPVGFYQQGKPLSDLPHPTREEIVFNLVNGLTGVMTLSSRLDLLNAEEEALVKEGIEAYRQIFPMLVTGYPTLPLGFTRTSDKQHALSFACDGGELLYLWATGEKTFSIPNASAYRQIFPKKEDSVIKQDSIALKGDTSARIFYKEG